MILVACLSLVLVWYLFVLLVSLLGCSAARRFRLSSPSPSPGDCPPVSILRPLKGLDSNLYENLHSTFTQLYPNYELILCVADSADQALPVARDLLAKFPHANARLIIGEDVVGINPKINNLIRAYRDAQHDILWVLDSNVLVHPHTLANAVHSLLHPRPPSLFSFSRSSRRVGLVHHVPFAAAVHSGVGSRIEEAFLNTNHAKMYLAINSLAIDSCVIGKSNMYRRSDVDQLTGDLAPAVSATTGLAAFGRFLAEDNMLASALWHQLDLRHELSHDPVRNAVGSMSFLAYIQRRVRWIRVRKYMTLAATLAEPFTECFLLSLLAACAAFRLLAIPPWLFLPVHYSLWIAIDLDVYKSLAGHPLPPSRTLPFLSAWAMRELMALPIWAVAVASDKIVWRGREYKVLRRGEVAPSPHPEEPLRVPVDSDNSIA